MDGLPAQSLRLSSEMLTDFRVCRGPRKEPVHHGPEVKAAPAHHQRPDSPLKAPSRLLPGRPAVVRGGEAVVGPRQVEAMMDNTGPLCGRRLRRPDIHPPVNLARVAV